MGVQNAPPQGAQNEVQNTSKSITQINIKYEGFQVLLGSVLGPFWVVLGSILGSQMIKFRLFYTDSVNIIPQTELAMRGSGGFLGTGGWTTGAPGPAVKKKVAVVRVWRTFGLKRWLWLENGGCACPVLEPQPLFFEIMHRSRATATFFLKNAPFSSHSHFFGGRRAGRA